MRPADADGVGAKHTRCAEAKKEASGRLSRIDPGRDSMATQRAFAVPARRRGRSAVVPGAVVTQWSVSAVADAVRTDSQRGRTRTHAWHAACLHALPPTEPVASHVGGSHGQNGVFHAGACAGWVPGFARMRVIAGRGASTLGFRVCGSGQALCASHRCSLRRCMYVYGLGHCGFRR